MGSFPREREAWCVFALLITSVYLASIDRQVIALLVDPIRRDLLLSDTQMGVLLGPAFALANSVALLPLGWYVDRANRRNILLAGILIWAMATAASSFANSFTALLLCRIVVGIGEACLIPAVFSLLGDLFQPVRRAFVFGLYMALVMIGSSFTLSLCGIVFDMLQQSQIVIGGISEPWRLTFLCASAPALLIMLGLLKVREPVRQLSGTVYTSTREYFRANWVTLCLVMMGVGGTYTAFYLVSTWFPTVLIREHGWSAQHAGSALGVALAVSALISCGITMTLPRRLHASLGRGAAFTVARISCLIAGPFSLVYLFTDPQWAMVGIIFLIIPTLTAYTLTPVIFQAMAPNNMWGRVVAMARLLDSIFFSAAVFSVGALSDRVFDDRNGIGSALALITFVMLGAAAIALFIVRKAYGRLVHDNVSVQRAQNVAEPDEQPAT